MLEEFIQKYETLCINWLADHKKLYMEKNSKAFCQFSETSEALRNTGQTWGSEINKVYVIRTFVSAQQQVKPITQCHLYW